jgi:hypothetical protein
VGGEKGRVYFEVPFSSRSARHRSIGTWFARRMLTDEGATHLLSGTTRNANGLQVAVLEKFGVGHSEPCCSTGIELAQDI